MSVSAIGFNSTVSSARFCSRGVRTLAFHDGEGYAPIKFPGVAMALNAVTASINELLKISLPEEVSQWFMELQDLVGGFAEDLTKGVKESSIGKLATRLNLEKLAFEKIIKEHSESLQSCKDSISSILEGFRMAEITLAVELSPAGQARRMTHNEAYRRERGY